MKSALDLHIVSSTTHDQTYKFALLYKDCHAEPWLVVTNPIGADCQVCLSRLVNSVAILGLEIWAGTHKGGHEGVLKLPQPLIEAGDAL